VPGLLTIKVSLPGTRQVTNKQSTPAGTHLAAGVPSAGLLLSLLLLLLLPASLLQLGAQFHR
jgi:hypothetical protein